MGNGDKEVTTIPRLYRTYYNTKANLDLLTGLLDGELGWGTDTTTLYRQDGAGVANWVSISPPITTTTVLTVAETEVFSGNSPEIWTDLDLSAVIGANPALVFLKITGWDNRTIAVRRNGDTDEANGDITNARGSALGWIETGVWIVLIVTADASGIIEWIVSAGSTANWTIDIIAFITE